MQIEIFQADLTQSADAEAFLEALNAYALDPMGGGAPLSEYARHHLIERLRDLPHAFSVLALVDGRVAGLANCFEGFSTFACAPLINIHDFVVLPAFRGQGLAIKMMDRIEQIALEKGCCKITLEVLSGNTVAQSLYQKVGFEAYALSEDAGQAEFWQKQLVSHH